MISFDSALGVEIRGDRLIFAAVRKGLNEFTLRACRAIENFRALTPQELASEARRILEGRRVNRDNVVLGVPRDQAVVRIVELPLEVEENLDQVVAFQVEKFEPAGTERSCYDYMVMERDEKQKKIRLQIVMVPRALIEEYLNLFRELKLYPAAIRFSSAGLHSLLTAHEDGYPQKEPFLILSLNPGELEMVVVTGRTGFYSDKVSSGGDWTFETVLAELDVFISRLELRVEGFSRIYLTGTRCEDLFPEFKEHFGECELLTTRLSVKRKALRASLMDAVGALGLALSGLSRVSSRRLNLIPEEKRLIGERPSLVPTVVLIGLLILLGSALATRDYFQKQSLLGQLEAQISTLQPEMDRIGTLRTEIADREAQLRELQGFMQGRDTVLVLLREITERVPDNSYLNNLTIVQGKVNIIGFSDSASGLLPILRESPHLENVFSRSITREPRTGRDRFQFEANIRESRERKQ